MRSAAVVMTVFVCAVSVVACGGGDGPSEAAGVPCDPERPASEGVTGHEFDFDAQVMPYFVAVPAGYDGSTKLQLQVLLPGGSGKAVPPADPGSGPEHNAILVIADIHGARRNVEMLQGLIETLVSDYCVDANRVGLIGMSSSSSFTAELAEASDDVVAAMAIGIGTFPPPAGAERAVPLLAWTGDTDERWVDRSVEAWVEINGCDPDPNQDVVGDVTTFRYQGCNAPVEYHLVSRMGHQTPAHQCPEPSPFCYETESLDLFEAATAFFDANPLTDS